MKRLHFSTDMFDFSDDSSCSSVDEIKCEDTTKYPPMKVVVFNQTAKDSED